jgi:hypothetical protein
MGCSNYSAQKVTLASPNCFWLNTLQQTTSITRFTADSFSLVPCNHSPAIFWNEWRRALDQNHWWYVCMLCVLTRPAIKLCLSPFPLDGNSSGLLILSVLQLSAGLWGLCNLGGCYWMAGNLWAIWGTLPRLISDCSWFGWTLKGLTRSENPIYWCRKTACFSFQISAQIKQQCPPDILKTDSLASHLLDLLRYSRLFFFFLSEYPYNPKVLTK